MKFPIRPPRPSPFHRWISTRSERVWVDGRYITIRDEGFWYLGPVAEAHTGAVFETEQYRFADNDSSSLDSLTLLGTLNTAFTVQLDTTYILVICTENIGDSNANNWVSELHYRVDGGSWTQVTNTSSNVRFVTALPADASTTTNKKLPTLGSSTFGTGYYEEPGGDRSSDINWDCAAGANMEHYHPMQFRSADLSGGEQIEFLLTQIDNSPLGTMNVTPTANIASAGPDARFFERRYDPRLRM